jgi:hypothetical protein
MKTAAIELLRQAKARGWTMMVDTGGDEFDYVGPSAVQAWNAIKAVGEGSVRFVSADGNTRVGWAYLMQPGPMTCDPEESLVDYTSRENDEFTAICDDLLKGYE